MRGSRNGNMGKIVGYKKLIHNGGLHWVVNLVKLNYPWHIF